MPTKKQQNIIKYVKPSKYGSEMFIVEKLNEKYNPYLKVKKYNNANFCFIEPDLLKEIKLYRNCCYKIVKMCGYDTYDDKEGYVIENIKLRKVEEKPKKKGEVKCLIEFDSDEED